MLERSSTIRGNKRIEVTTMNAKTHFRRVKMTRDIMGGIKGCVAPLKRPSYVPSRTAECILSTLNPSSSSLPLPLPLPVPAPHPALLLLQLLVLPGIEWPNRSNVIV
jgi:hypothetical protein